MSAHPLILATLAMLASLPFTGTATAQNRGCVVEQAPPLNFGQPAANPTANETTSTAVTVRCTGNGSEGGATVRVCISLNTLGQATQRQMLNGASVLGYQIRANSPTGPVLSPNQTADGEMILDQGTTSSPFGTVTIPLYGVITAGQMGLDAGNYTEAIISGEVRSTANPPTGCTTVIQAPLITSASAELPDSCRIVADDLAFGSHSSLAGGVDAAAGIRLTCTGNTAWAVGIDGGVTGNRRMRRNGVDPESIGYGLYQDAGRFQVWGNAPLTTVGGVGTGLPEALTAYGRVPLQPTPLPGDYRDTVVVTVEY